jgi:hypothetical protein
MDTIGIPYAAIRADLIVALQSDWPHLIKSVIDTFNSIACINKLSTDFYDYFSPYFGAYKLCEYFENRENLIRLFCVSLEVNQIKPTYIYKPDLKWTEIQHYNNPVWNHILPSKLIAANSKYRSPAARSLDKLSVDLSRWLLSNHPTSLYTLLVIWNENSVNPLINPVLDQDPVKAVNNFLSKINDLEKIKILHSVMNKIHKSIKTSTEVPEFMIALKSIETYVLPPVVSPLPSASSLPSASLPSALQSALPSAPVVPQLASPASKKSFIAVRGEIKRIMIVGYPWRLYEIINTMNQRYYEIETLGNSYSMDPNIGMEEFLLQFDGESAAKSGKVKRLYETLGTLGFAIKDPWSSLMEYELAFAPAPEPVLVSKLVPKEPALVRDDTYNLGSRARFTKSEQIASPVFPIFDFAGNKKVDVNTNTNTCSVCLDNDSRVMPLCGHPLCFKCGNDHKELDCVICRKPYGGRFIEFFTPAPQ